MLHRQRLVTVVMLWVKLKPSMQCHNDAHHKYVSNCKNPEQPGDSSKADTAPVVSWVLTSCLVGDLADCVMRAGAKRSLSLEKLPEIIASHSYDLKEPPNGSASWVEELSESAARLKDQLTGISSLNQTMRSQVSSYLRAHPAAIDSKADT